MEPIIQVPVDETLEVLDHGNKWMQGDWADGDRMCLHQGIRQCQKQLGDALLIEQVAARYGWGTAFNDDPATTFDMVKQRLVEHREVFPEELEVTFGPQWQLVVQLVRRAVVLTADEASALYAARNAARNAASTAAQDAAWDAAQDAAWGAARDAAWGAARDAARDAAWDAAQDAAWGAAWGAAWDAAWDAASAVVLVDLVGSHGLEQHHIDTLAGPWRQVIGDPFTLPG